MTVKKNFRFGIDLGGTSAKLAVVSEKGKIVKESSVESGGISDPKQLVKKISNEAKRLTQSLQIQSIGVGVAGDIDSGRGLIRVSPNLGWKNVPLKKLLEKELKRKVTIDNDANVAAWGIYKTQVSQKVKNLFVLTLGTGVGGGIIVDKKLYVGATGSAGEIGHVTVEENGRLCNCGNRGCLETIAGGTHIKAVVKERLAQGEKSSLQDIFKKDPESITPYLISKAALEGDAFSISIWENVGKVLGVALGNLIYVFNPEAIYLTGGVAQAKDLILKPIWTQLKTRSFKTPIGAVQITVAKEASHIGVIGAALLQ